MKPQIKIIEQNIKEILKEGQDFIKLHKQFHELLNNIDSASPNLNQKREKLLNILLKYPKKKILFNFEFKEEDNYLRTFKIGLNESGLGLSSSGEHNLRNIDDYWAKKTFMKLFKNEEFKKLLFLNIKRNKKIIEKVINSFNEDKSPVKIIPVGKIKIQINQNIKYFNEKNDEIEILKEGEEFNLKELKNFSELLKHKEKIMKIINKEIKEYKKIEKEIKKEEAELNNELKPYETLQQI